MSWGPGTRTHLIARTSLAIAGFLGAISGFGRTPLRWGPDGWDTILPPIVLGLAMATSAAGAMAIIRQRQGGRGALWLVIVAGLGDILERLVIADPGGTSHGKALPAAALLAWWAGQRSHDRREAFEYVSGVAAAAYLLSAMSKLSAKGLAWINGDALALLMVERVTWTTAPWAPLVEWVAVHPTLTWSMAAFALILELAGPAMLVPSLRIPFAIASVTFHAGIGMFLGYWHVEFPLIVIAATFGTSSLRGDPSDPGTNAA